MSEPKLISPLLDNFAMGEAISDSGGVRICPAMDQSNGDKYIVKIFSNPSSATQLDAMVLSGAYADRSQALRYYQSVAQDIVKESELLNKLSELDGFLPNSGCQLIESDDESGYDVYTLTPYRMSLDRYWTKHPMTHLSALNLGLDLCSALTVCRRCGHIYVALSPENIYLTDDQGFRLGDIGFLPLDSLKYASMPDRYRSAYTPPEIEDAYASINTTVDVYAVGMILYQIFNGGRLPESGLAELPSPEFADYEIAEIILKACAKDPAARWEDAAQMGQALVDYMQRNGAHDTAIAPPPVEIPAAVEPVVDVQEATQNIAPVESTTVENNTAGTDDHISAEEIIDQTIDIQITDEVSDMLSQADELIAHEAPAPVVAPEPIEVQLPVQTQEEPEAEVIEQIKQETAVPTDIETAEQTDIETAEQTDIETAEQTEPEIAEQTETAEATECGTESSDEKQTEVSEEPVTEVTTAETPAAEDNTASAVENEPKTQNSIAEEFYDDDDDYIDYSPVRKSHWLRNTLIVLLLLSLLVGGFLFYRHYYLQHIDNIDLIGDDLSLTVQVYSRTDESLLTVSCYDTGGNCYTSPVVNGTATFENLIPGCVYTVEISINGFHKLTGLTIATHSTPMQTNVVEFIAKTGEEDGSAIFNFTIEGPDNNNWIIRKTSADGTYEDYPCTQHTCTITGLTVGSEYAFELLVADGKQITGNTKINHTARSVIKAVNPQITGYQDGMLSITWEAPENTEVSSWEVHCFNDRGYDKTITCADLNATFDQIVGSDPYTIEIIAEGMSAATPAYVTENFVSISNLAVTATNSTSITLSWTNTNNPPQNGWILRYSIDGSPVKEVKTTNADSVTLTPYIPDCTYSFTLLTADSGDVIGGDATYTTKEADDFSGYTIKRKNMKFKMCLTPNVTNWTVKNLRKSDYTTTFKANQKASFLVYINKTYSVSSNKIHITYVIRDSQENVVTFSTKEIKWANMWKGGYGEFDLPALPKTAGQYSVTVYFNDAVAGQQSFRVK